MYFYKRFIAFSIFRLFSCINIKNIFLKIKLYYLNALLKNKYFEK